MQIDNRSFYADMFSKADTPAPAPRREPAAAVAVREPKALVAAREPQALVPVVIPKPVKAGGGNDETAKPVLKARSALYELIGDIDTHHLSPRQMSELSLDLYATGAISFEDYSALAFQPELHPDFDRTIGALTGERADPDRPRDFVRLWDDRADFQRRHNAARADLVEQSERIASVLRQIETPPMRLAV